MQDKFFQVDSTESTLQDLAAESCIKPFGGVTVVLGGDFQHILPVVRKGLQEQIVGRCIQTWVRASPSHRRDA